MIWYKPQSMNPDKHYAMPDAYPWCVSYSYDSEAIEINEIEYELLLSSIDLTEYLAIVQSENNLKQQTEQREFGLSLIPFLIDSMGERNLTLSQNGNQINMIAIASDNSGVKLLIETGALKTARSICSQLKYKYTLHADIYNNVISNITEFLQSKGYE